MQKIPQKKLGGGVRGPEWGRVMFKFIKHEFNKRKGVLNRFLQRQGSRKRCLGSARHVFKGGRGRVKEDFSVGGRKNGNPEKETQFYGQQPGAGGNAGGHVELGVTGQLMEKNTPCETRREPRE